MKNREIQPVLVTAVTGGISTIRLVGYGICPPNRNKTGSSPVWCFLYADVYRLFTPFFVAGSSPNPPATLSEHSAVVELLADIKMVECSIHSVPILLECSSAVERPAVNRCVVGSSPTFPVSKLHFNGSFHWAGAWSVV